MARKIEVVSYDPEWPDHYTEEADLLFAALEGCLVALHHIGSTAVPGLKAKPTIDILGVVTSFIDLAENEPKLIGLGYEPRGENGIRGRRYFVKKELERHLIHFHVFEFGHPDIAKHIKFRDYLRTHPEEAQAYQKLKEDLATRYQNDPPRYTLGKAGFIQGILERTDDR